MIAKIAAVYGYLTTLQKSCIKIKLVFISEQMTLNHFVTVLLTKFLQSDMKTLTNLLSNHFQMINSRLNIFCGIIKSMLLTRGINFKHFASEINSKVKLSSKEQAVSRFLINKNLITMDSFYQFISQYFPKEKVVS